MVNSEELKQYLETRQTNMSKQEFFLLILDMLQNETTKEARALLESYLITYSSVDEDQVARYLEQFLFDPDPYRMEFALLELMKLSAPDSVADKILIKFSEDGLARLEKEGILEKPSLDEEMKSKELEQYFESRRKSMTEKEFFELILGILEDDPAEETRDVLKKYLLAYSFADKDRVARYLEKFLSDPDPFQREFVVHDLALLARDPNSLAYKILTDYLGEEPTEDKKTRIMMERLIKLFPSQDAEED